MKKLPITYNPETNQDEIPEHKATYKEVFFELLEFPFLWFAIGFILGMIFLTFPINHAISNFDKTHTCTLKAVN